MAKTESWVQGELFLSTTDKESYFLAFKKLYYHLYANSAASRAERIISDLSKIMISKLASDRGLEHIVMSYIKGYGSANEVLLPALRQVYPQFYDESDTFTIGDAAIRSSLAILSSVDLADAPSYVIGEAFQALIGPRLRGEKGQFFTPRTVVKAMVEIVAPQPTDKVVDPACGTGGFLAETYSYWEKQGYQPNGYDTKRLIGIDKDRDLTGLTTAMLEIVAPDQYLVLNADSLDLTALRNSGHGEDIFDASVVLTNPPFGSKIKVSRGSILRQFELGYQWTYSKSEQKWRQTTKLRKSQDPQLLFLELCLKLLKPGGILGIILPEGVFGNRQTGYVWEFLREQGEVTALIDCPRTTFQPGTDTKTNILFFKKTLIREAKALPKVSIAVALACGHDRRGRASKEDGSQYPDDFPQIAQEWNQGGDKFWSNCEISQPHYWVPRYYDGSVKKQLQKEAARLKAQLMTFGELQKAGYLRIRKGNEVGAEAYGTGNIPFIRTSDLSNWEISIDPTKSVSERFYQKFAKRQQLKVNDILLVLDGRYRIGRTAILHEANVKSVVQSHILIITVTKKAPFNAYQLLYLLNRGVVLAQMRNLTFIQSTLASLGKRIEKLQLPIPTPSDDWLESTRKFESLLKQRAQVLWQLQAFQSREPEL